MVKREIIVFSEKVLTRIAIVVRLNAYNFPGLNNPGKFCSEMEKIHWPKQKNLESRHVVLKSVTSRISTRKTDMHSTESPGEKQGENYTVKTSVADFPCSAWRNRERKPGGR